MGWVLLQGRAAVLGFLGVAQLMSWAIIKHFSQAFFPLGAMETMGMC